MKVGFDISQIAHQGGVATYSQNLAEYLSKISDLEMEYFYSSLRKPYRGNLPNVRSFRLPPTLLEFLFNRARIVPIENFIGEIDIFHSSDWLQPKTKALKITTYHDVVPLKYPQWSHPKIVQVHKRRLEIVEKEIDIVIAVSESTKRDLMEVSKIPENKITVIYEAAGEQFKPQAEKDVQEFKKRMNLPEKFVLSIGGIGERRNLDRVKKIAKNYNLIITREDIPLIPDEEMPLLYASAAVLLYPSFYEGFGLPILEAMACGTPVITSNVSSMPEVAGESALLVDPFDENDMQNKIDNLMGSKILKDELRAKGLKRAKLFSWEKTAEHTMEVYKKVVNL